MKVAFYQPRHFNRTDRKTNPFFDPIISVCEKNGIPYRIYQPYRRPDTGYPKVYSSQYLRKFVRLFRWGVGRFLHGKKEHEIDRLAGKVWNVLTLGRYRADVYITIAYELYGVWTGINPKARVVDVQHGLICFGHWGYLDNDGTVSKFARQFAERETWVAGDGYRKLFMRRPENAEWVSRHVKVVGDCFGHVLREPDLDIPFEDRIVLFCLQLTDELSPVELQDVLSRSMQFLRELRTKGVDLENVVLRHHPRYSGVPDMKTLFAEFPEVRLSSLPLEELLRRTMVHVTFSSTTVFDAAAYGVPTYLIARGKALPLGIDGVDWKNDFFYPFSCTSYEEIVRMVKHNQVDVVTKMHDWFSWFYRPFDHSAALGLLCREESGK